MTTPTDLVKIRQQTQISSAGILPSSRQVALSILKTEGIRGLYRGLTVTCLRDSGYGVYFATYEASCRLLLALKDPSKPFMPDVNHASLMQEAESFESALSWPELMVSGGLAGVTGWVSTFPLDVVKSRIQGTRSDSSSGSHPYRGVNSALAHCFRTEGLRGLFAGLTPTLWR